MSAGLINQREVIMNKIDQYIERAAYELFAAQDLPADLIEFKIKELQICVDRGYNSRAEIVRLIKLAGVSA
jgi:hypothetical protein